jgi:hypothetical protein
MIETSPAEPGAGTLALRRALLSRGAALLASVAAVTASLAFGATPASARPPIFLEATASKQKAVVTFGIAPANAKGPDGRGYFSFGATPGARISDRLAVTNYSGQTLSLTLHASDAANTAEGDFALLPPNSPAPVFGDWVGLPAGRVNLTIGPRATIVVPFQISVPSSADPGDHIGGILATLTSAVIGNSGQRLKLLESVGTRIFVRVSGPLHPGLTVAGLRIRYRGALNPIGKGTVSLIYTVKNTGNVGLGGRQTVWVSGLFGSKTYAKSVPDVQLLLPGYSITRTVSLPRVFPELSMKAHVLISPLVIPGSILPPSGPYRQDLSFWAIPWILLAIVAGILAGLAALILRRRRRRRNQNAALARPSPTSPAAASAKTNLGGRGSQASEPDATNGRSHVGVQLDGAEVEKQPLPINGADPRQEMEKP